MKKVLFGITFISALLCAEISFAMSGVIALMNDDKIIIADPYGSFSVGTFYTYPPYNVGRGDIIYGPVQSYGSNTFYDDTAEIELTIYIDDVMLDADSALDSFSGR